MSTWKPMDAIQSLREYSRKALGPDPEPWDESRDWQTIAQTMAEQFRDLDETVNLDRIGWLPTRNPWDRCQNTLTDSEGNQYGHPPEEKD